MTDEFIYMVLTKAINPVVDIVVGLTVTELCMIGGMRADNRRGGSL